MGTESDGDKSRLLAFGITDASSASQTFSFLFRNAVVAHISNVTFELPVLVGLVCADAQTHTAIATSATEAFRLFA